MFVCITAGGSPLCPDSSGSPSSISYNFLGTPCSSGSPGLSGSVGPSGCLVLLVLLVLPQMNDDRCYQVTNFNEQVDSCITLRLLKKSTI